MWRCLRKNVAREQHTSPNIDGPILRRGSSALDLAQVGAIMVAGNNRAGMSSDMSGISNCDSEERLINKGALIAEPREVGKVLRRTAEKKRESPIVDGELTGFRSLTTEAEEMLTLSKKEHAVMKMYSRGLTTQSVARKMSIAESTAKTYARRAYRKLGVGSRAEAVTMLAKWGIV